MAIAKGGEIVGTSVMKWKKRPNGIWQRVSA